MEGYTAIESGIKERVLAHFSSELTAETCVIADSDNLFRAIFEKNAAYGCLLDMGIPPGRQASGEPYKSPVWIWQIIGVFLLRYEGDTTQIEAKARAVVDKLQSLLDADHTLGGLSDKARVVLIDTPEVTEVNDVPFYFMPFMVEAWDK